MSDSNSNANGGERPTLCRNCRAIVGAGQTECAVCGDSTAIQPESTAPRPRVDNETVRFARAIIDRPHKFTIILIVLNLFALLLLWDSSQLTSQALFDGFPGGVLIVYGAKLNFLIDGPYHQWWRFVTPMFLHGNLIHLLVNMYSLWILGPYVEKLYGSAKFVFFWVLTGIGSCVASYFAFQPGPHPSLLGRFLLHSIDLPTVGASGSLFGLVGVLFVFGIRFRRELPDGFKRAFGLGMLPIIIINLLIGYLGSGIDNAGHMGGFASGIALALIVDFRRPGDRSAISIAWRVLQVLSIAIVLVSFYKVGRYFNDTKRLVESQIAMVIDATQKVRLNYMSLMTQGQETAAAVIHERDVSNVGTITQALTQMPAPDAKASELRDRLVALLAKLNNDVTTKNATNPPGEIDPKLIEERNILLNDYDGWLRTTRQPNN